MYTVFFAFSVYLSLLISSRNIAEEFFFLFLRTPVSENGNKDWGLGFPL